MSDEFDTWLVLLTAGMSLSVAGFLFLDGVAQYATLAVGLLVSLLAVRRADRESSQA